MTPAHVARPSAHRARQGAQMKPVYSLLRIMALLASSALVGCPTPPSSPDAGASDAGFDTQGPLDGGRDDGGTDAGERDAPAANDGGGSDAPISCEPRTASPPSPGGVCARSTLECILTTTTASGQAACVAADPTPTACAECLDQDLQNSCTSRGFCNAEYGRRQCCLEARCPTGEPSCIAASLATGGACLADGNALARCDSAAVMMRRCGISPVCASP